MKKIAVSMIILIAFAGMVFSQDIGRNTFLQEEYNYKVLKKLGFTDGEIKGLVKIQQESQQVILNAKAEMDIYKAELKKLLLSPDVNMRDVEKLLRKSMEWELKVRVAQIKRQVDSRKLVGERKWVQLVRYLQKRQAAYRRVSAVKNLQRKAIQKKKNSRQGKSQVREERVKRLLKELEQLLNQPQK
ncbi:MAG: hypothetical protein GXP33_16715 [Spirochaetes bacterium]|nr:hypothetical protein [Spirochaetota bacterium]